MDGVELDVAVYTIIIDGFCKSGRLDEAWDMFHSLSLKGFDPDVKTYTAMIEGLCMESLVEEAKNLLHRGFLDDGTRIFKSRGRK
ncbi:OLC1v1012200C1 [Oldenlandia corymbosa var. corymbosa]|uniref:OLC1v1012200C1 n=1 Tax=Oldenlandia corymbosa var. corymbosa TaxID=529605 RepID=A0AAV1DXL4_OLDCO|nr:OLC1v1012200C1 [Oldenlandia corymbosa var. corymbosa]